MMPVDNLTPDSGIQTIRDAISASMEACMKEGGKDMKQCAGMIYGIAREKTGQSLSEGKQQ